jgi:hypothetical protein
MSVVRRGELLTFYRVKGGSGAAGGGGINANRPVRWGGETTGRVGSQEGGSAVPFLGEEGAPGQFVCTLEAVPAAAPLVARKRSWVGPTRQ